jgi:phage-related protein
MTSAIRNTLVGTFTNAKAQVFSIWTGLKAGVTNTIGAVLSVVQSLKGKVTGIFSGAGSWLLNIGQSIVNGLVNGLRNGLGRVMDAARALADAIPYPIRQALGIASPSKVTTEFGGAVGDGLRVGIAGSAARVGVAAAGLADAASAGLRKRLAGTNSTLSAAMPVGARLTAGLAGKAVAGLATQARVNAAAPGAALADASLRTAPVAAGGVTVHAPVTVQGHVLTEKRLADVLAPHVRDAVVRKGRNNGGRTGL